MPKGGCFFEQLRKNLLFLLVLLTFSCSWGQYGPNTVSDSLAQQKWVDDQYNNLTLEEKIGQLFMVIAHSDQDQAHIQSIQNAVENDRVGGLIFSTGGPVRQARLTNLYQSKAKVPLLIGMDAE